MTAADKKKLVIGSDHAGWERKTQMVSDLKGKGFPIEDYGCSDQNSCDYPDFAKKVALAVSKGKADRGILICGTGIGMAIAANKFPGIRAAVCWNIEVAKVASEHNHANVLCLPGRWMDAETMKAAIGAWLETPWGAQRHESRVKKIMRLEDAALC